MAALVGANLPFDSLAAAEDAAPAGARTRVALTAGEDLALSTADGSTVAELRLKSPPVFDGMGAADGRWYLATKNGEVVCLGPAR